MATATTLPAVQRQSSLSHTFARVARSPTAAVMMATAAAFLLLGYHPYAEDGGIYAAALAARMDPLLFPLEHAFAIGQTRQSLFIALLALLARTLHLSLASTLLLSYVACLAATVAAAQSLAKALFRSPGTARRAAATLVATLGLPIAGTSLYLYDPYLTARSISTPLLLFGLVLLLRRRIAAFAACLLIAFALHPMMSATAAVLFAFVQALGSRRRTICVATLAVAIVSAMALLAFVPQADGDAVRAASVSRSYWFLSLWAWYEIVGLVAPMLLLYATVYRRELFHELTPAASQLALATAMATAVVCAGMLLFVHPANGSMLLARLQPLRLLHMVYLVFVLLLGGLAGSIRLARRVWFAGALCILSGVGLLCMQRSLYPQSGHVELPWQVPVNEYQRAFVWARDHTPTDALFALDGSYTTAHGEEAQLFRAIALRSSLPDAAKDGGIASVVPELAPAWLAASRAQAGFAAMDDAQRLQRVRPLGASWTVLPSVAATHLDCPYSNRTAKVCRLP